MATVAPPIKISLADNGRRMTLDEFLEAEEEEGYRYELARGVLEVTPVPGAAHGRIVHLFYKMFTRYEDAHPGLIDRFGGAGEFRVYLPEMESGRNPDLAVSLLGTPLDEDDDRPPSLCIEVVSEGNETRTCDYVTKRQEYLAFGLREYWIVDRFERRVTVLRRRGDSWIEAVFRDGQVASGRVLPGFAVAVADLWIGLPDEGPTP